MDAAILCDPGEPGQIAQAAGRLMDDPQLRVGMGRAARRRYDKNFTRGHFLDAMTGVFTDVLES